MPPSFEQSSTNSGNNTAKPNAFQFTQAHSNSTSSKTVKSKAGKKKNAASVASRNLPSEITQTSVAELSARSHGQSSPELGPDDGLENFASPLLGAITYTETSPSKSPPPVDNSESLGGQSRNPSFPYAEKAGDEGSKADTEMNSLKDMGSRITDFMSPSFPSTPSPTYPKPVQSPNNFPVITAQGLPSHSPPSKGRRASMYANRPTFPSPGGHPPLPHHPQAHFYGTPQLDFGLAKRQNELKAGHDEYFCGFDTLPYGISGDEATADVVLIGWEGGLDVMRIENDRLEARGRLTGLRGGVFDAKILPSTSRIDNLLHRRPLIILSISGPAVSSSTNKSQRGQPTAPSAAEHGSVIDSSAVPSGSLIDDDSSQSSYKFQTTVEVYSLSDFGHVATLYESPVTEYPVSPSSPLFERPRSIGQLSVQVSGRFITISSGQSGEILIFESRIHMEECEASEPTFTCIGKTWTSLASNSKAHRSRASSASDSRTAHTSSLSDPPQSGRPICSLSHRWLAYSPQSPSRPFLGGSALLNAPSSSIPGLSSHQAPPQPSTNVLVESPDAEGLMNWVAREVTQEVIKGAKWVGGRALQTFNSYFNSQNSGPETTAISGSPPPQRSESHYSNYQTLPPTHALSDNRDEIFKEASLVSILDLEKLSRSHSSHSAGPTPEATFQAPQGCSFVSFAPNGLSLLTASTKGDVQFVWSLMRILHGRNPKSLNPPSNLAHKAAVRQIARFTRMTTAVIIDVIWSSSNGHRLALVTDNGTVHVHELHISAFQWPPRRPPKYIEKEAADRLKADTSEANRTTSGAAASAVNAVSSALQLVGNTAQPIISAAQGTRRQSGSQTLAGGALSVIPQYRKPSGQAVAHGLSKSLGAASGTVNKIRNVGENRIRIPPSGSPIKFGCASWLHGRYSGYLAVVGDGTLKIHKIGHRIVDQKGDKRRVFAAKSTTSFSLWNLPDFPVAPSIASELGIQLERNEYNPSESSWCVPSAKPATTSKRLHPLTFAEIETMPPFHPFHDDRRVTMHIFDKDHSQGNEGIPFVFGEDIPSVKLDIGYSDASDNRQLSGPLVTSTENLRTTNAGDEVVDHIIVTTRRRRQGSSILSSAGNVSNGDETAIDDDWAVLDFALDRV